jgi:hypothetical protein
MVDTGLMRGLERLTGYFLSGANDLFEDFSRLDLSAVRHHQIAR